MNTVEDRLREAYRAATETVRPQTLLADGVRGLHDRDWPPAERPGRLSSPGRLLVPLAAAAAVTAVVIAASTVAPRQASGRGGPPQATAAGGGTPAFFVALNWSLRPSMVVVNARTGARGAAIGLPFRATDLRAVATGDGSTFVVAAARPAACRTSLYRFGVSGQGEPAALTRFATVPGVIESPWNLAVARDGRTIAYDALACGQSRRSYLAVVNTATGQTTRWTFEAGTGHGAQALTDPADVSLSADGRTVAFRDWVVRTNAAPGSLVRRGRVVVRNGELGPSTVLGGLEIAPNAKTVYFDTFRVRHGKPVWGNWQLRTFDLVTGQTSLVRNLPGTQGTPAAVSADPTGRFLMIEYAARHGTRLARLDVATGQLGPLNARWVVDAAIAW